MAPGWKLEANKAFQIGGLLPVILRIQAFSFQL